MELNSFSCAGLYGCDMESIVERAINIAKRQYQTNLRDGLAARIPGS